MNIQAATSPLKPYLRFPFQDGQSTSRFAIGCALLFGSLVVPIVPGLLVSGYALRVLRSTAQGETPSMPPWDDWSGFLSLGFRGAIVSMLFTLPGLLVFLMGFAAYLGTFILIPLSTGDDPATSSPLLLLVFGAFAFWLLSLALGTLLTVLGIIPLPASLSHLVVKDELGAAFRVREWWPLLSANRLGFFISFLILAGILGITYFGIMALYYTLVLMCIAFLLTVPVGFYTMLVGGALFGDNYREGCELSKSRRGASAPAPVETTFMQSSRQEQKSG